MLLATILAEASLSATLLAPELAVRPVPPLATGSVPVTHEASGRPVTLVITPLPGVPRAGVVRIGEVSVLFVSVAVAVRSVALDVLSTFHSPTAALSRV